MRKAYGLLIFLLFAFGSLGAQTVISDVYVLSSTSTTATIVWTTDTPANSQIKYGLDSSLPYQNNIDPAMVTSHQMKLTVLNANQPYYFAVLSRDAGGTLAQSPTVEFALCGSSTPAMVPVTGSINIPYAFGTYTMTWVPPSGATATPTTCGQPMVSPVTGSLDQMGSMINAVANDALRTTPGPGSWAIHVADPGGIAAVDINVPVSFQSNQITDPLRAAAQPLGLVNIIATPTQCYYPWACTGTGGGGGIAGPAGSDQMVQYNKANLLAGDANLKWDYTNQALSVGGTIPAGAAKFTLGPHTTIVTSWTFDTYSPGTALNSVLAGATGCSSAQPLVQYNGTCAPPGSTFTGYPGVTTDSASGLNIVGGVTLTNGTYKVNHAGAGLVGPNTGQALTDDSGSPGGGWNFSSSTGSVYGFRFWKGAAGTTQLVSIDGTNFLKVYGPASSTQMTVTNSSAGGYLRSSGISPLTDNNQGAYLAWNIGYGALANQGHTAFLNRRGSGVGGFDWYNQVNNDTTLSAPLMQLDNVGDLAVARQIASGNGYPIVSSGNVYAGGTGGTGTVYGATFTGNAATATSATQLSADPANCAVGQVPSGIDSHGVAQNCSGAYGFTSGYSTVSGAVGNWVRDPTGHTHEWGGSRGINCGAGPCAVTQNFPRAFTSTSTCTVTVTVTPDHITGHTGATQNTVYLITLNDTGFQTETTSSSNAFYWTADGCS